LNLGTSAASQQATLQAEEGKANAIPTYRVQDGSKIGMNSVDTASQESFVRNNFTDNSLDWKLASGFGGIGIAASGSHSWGDQHEGGESEKKLTRKIIGKYMVRMLSSCSAPSEVVADRKVQAAPGDPTPQARGPGGDRGASPGSQTG
jgi:hypothetical protein